MSKNNLNRLFFGDSRLSKSYFGKKKLDLSFFQNNLSGIFQLLENFTEKSVDLSNSNDPQVKTRITKNLIQYLRELEFLKEVKMQFVPISSNEELDDLNLKINKTSQMISEICTRKYSKKTHNYLLEIPRVKELLETITILQQNGPPVQIQESQIIEILGKFCGERLKKKMDFIQFQDNLQFGVDFAFFDEQQTFENAIFREGKSPPDSILLKDYDSHPPEKSNILWFLVDMSESMGLESTLTFSNQTTPSKLDIVKLVMLGIQNFFQDNNEFKQISQIKIVPIHKKYMNSKDFKIFTLEKDIPQFLTFIPDGRTPTGCILGNVVSEIKNLKLQGFTENQIIIIISDGLPNLASDDFKATHLNCQLFLSDAQIDELDIPRKEVRCNLLEAIRYSIKICYFLIPGSDEKSDEVKKLTSEMLSNICKLEKINPKNILEDLEDLTVRALFD